MPKFQLKQSKTYMYNSCTNSARRRVQKAYREMKKKAAREYKFNVPNLSFSPFLFSSLYPFSVWFQNPNNFTKLRNCQQYICCCCLLKEIKFEKKKKEKNKGVWMTHQFFQVFYSGVLINRSHFVWVFFLRDKLHIVSCKKKKIENWQKVTSVLINTTQTSF